MHRDVAIIELSRAIGDLVAQRARTYTAYRAGPGPDGVALPSDFAVVVRDGIAFADALAHDAPPATFWDPALRLWNPPTR